MLQYRPIFALWYNVTKTNVPLVVKQNSANKDSSKAAMNDD